MFAVRNYVKNLVKRPLNASLIGNYSHTENLVSLSRRLLSSSNSIEDAFKLAVSQVTGLRSEPGNEVKLKLYALYKQSTSGPCTAPKPGMFDVVAKYKWEAWNNLGSQSKDDSMKEYISLVESLIQSIGLVEADSDASKGTSSASQSSSSSASSSTSSDPIVISNKQGVLTLRLNRPEKKNALLTSMYHQITNTFNEAAKDDNVKLVVITGTGDFFSSGNDLIKGLGASIVHHNQSQSTKNQSTPTEANFQIKPTDDIAKLAKESATLLENFVNAFIDFPKPLIAVVNGPAFGIMVTTLALCDNVICSDNATFQTPFLSTSQTPEGCSTYTFPRIMGTAKANAMLLFNERLTAQEAFQCGFVSKVIPRDQLTNYVDSWLFGDKGLLSFGTTLTWTKGKPLIRTEEERQLLRKISAIESKVLAESWLSPEFTQAMMRFFTRKK